MDDLELAEAMAAATAKRVEAVAGAAFLSLLADALKARAADAKAKAVQLSEAHKAERTTGKHNDVEIGKLAQNRETVEWDVIGHAEDQMMPGGELFAYIDKHYPSWIDHFPEEVISKTIPERHQVNHARMVELCQTLAVDCTDPHTGEKVPGVRRTTKPGSWVLTKDRKAKALVATAVAAMMKEGLPGLAEIEGGK